MNPSATEPSAVQRPPQVGEPAPWFAAASTANPRFVFDTVAGRHIVLCFFGSAGHPLVRGMLDEVLRHREVFDDEHFCFFGVSVDPDDQRLERVRQIVPGFRYFWDFDGTVSRAYGALEAGSATYHPQTFILDPRLRILGIVPLGDDPQVHAARVLEFARSTPAPGPAAPAAAQAPVLLVPDIFEPSLCRRLIELYERHGGAESGFMRDVNGRTTAVMDHSFKRRRDHDIEDPEVRCLTMHRIHDRLAPEICKAFQFRATRMERYIVACYDGEAGGHFRPHRDNTTRGTAHRRFAVSINLNAEEFEGGDLRFPEFGRHTYRPPTGGAVVFSCSLLHEATPVTRGRRYAFLPFLYDEAAARIRQENFKYLDPTPPTAGPSIAQAPPSSGRSI